VSAGRPRPGPRAGATAAGTAATERAGELASGPQRTARERILESACDLIAEEGIDEVRIARVAMRASASTALVHHYFSTREELLEQALLHSFELAGDERFGTEDEQGAAPVSATKGLARAIRECLPEPGPQEREWVLWVELWLRAVRDPGLRPVAARLYARYRDWIAVSIESGVASGEFEPVKPERCADHAMALFDGLGLRALLGDPAMTLPRARRLIAEILGRELGVDPAELC
jgi:AcrR family transcriptional regulator